MLKYSCNTEISNFDLVGLCHKDVLGLKIAMQNLSIVNVLDCQTHLHEPVQDLVFAVHN